MIEEVLGKLGFDWKVALANLVNFLIIYFLLRKVVFKKLTTAIKTRQQKIQEGLENAKKAEAVLVEASSRKDDLLKDAYKESQDILSQAKDQKNKIVASAGEEASLEATKIRQNAIEEAEMILQKADKDLTQKAVDLVVDGVEKVFKDKLTKDLNETYIVSMLK